jgi:hypothetical protein
LRKKAQFQLSLQLGPNVKDKRKPTKKTKKEGKVDRRTNDNEKRTGR